MGFISRKELKVRSDGVPNYRLKVVDDFPSALSELLLLNSEHAARVVFNVAASNFFYLGATGYVGSFDFL